MQNIYTIHIHSPHIDLKMSSIAYLTIFNKHYIPRKIVKQLLIPYSHTSIVISQTKKSFLFLHTESSFFYSFPSFFLVYLYKCSYYSAPVMRCYLIPESLIYNYAIRRGGLVPVFHFFNVSTKFSIL